MNNRKEKIASNIENQRREMETTLSALEARLSPGRLIDDVIKRNGSTAQLFSTAKTQIAQNPFATALIGAGLAMMVTSRNGESHAARDTEETGLGQETWYDSLDADDDDDTDYDGDIRSYTALQQLELRTARFAGETDDDFDRRRTVARGEALNVYAADDEDYMSFRDRVEARASQVKASADRVLTKISNAQSRASDKVKASFSSAKSSVKDGYRSAQDSAASRYESASQSVQSSFADGKARTKQMASRAKAKSKQLHENSPVALGGMIFAAAAALGAATPNTRYTDGTFGDLADDLRDTGRDVLSHAKDTAKTVARDMKEEARTQRDALKSEFQQGAQKRQAEQGYSNGHSA